MPTYEYRCAACGAQHDIFQRMSDPAAVDCPTCGAPKLERLVSASAFALKGSGWYADGYGVKGEATKPEAKSEAKPEAKSEAKPEAKPDPKPAEAAKS